MQLQDYQNRKQNTAVESKNRTFSKGFIKRPENKTPFTKNVNYKKTSIKGKNSKIKVLNLGGLHEVGKNMTVIEYENEIIIIDCGVAFPENEMLGIDLVIPDITYLEQNRGKIKGIVLTHGHEDHIGAVPYILKNFQYQFMGQGLTLGLLEIKLREHKLIRNTKLHTVKAGDNIELGKFSVEFIHVNHSIADAVALVIRTPSGTIVHTGDFKIDYNPMDGKIIDFHRFAEIGEEGVDLLMCDSTNAGVPGFTISERSIGDVFRKIFDETKENRIMVATFSSNIHRIQQVIDCAGEFERKVAVIGRSMVNAVKTAKELGYLDIPNKLIIDVKDIRKYADNEIVIITTGSQGEPMAALSRIASSNHKFISVVEGDKIIISASSIPGNEKAIGKVMNGLLLRGAEIVNDRDEDIHVSGHAKQEELKIIHALVKAKNFMPVHGEFIHMKEHKELAISMGMPKENIFLMSNGDSLEVLRGKVKLGQKVPSGQILVDGLGVGDVGSIVLRDRKHLSQDGIIIVVLALDKKSGKVASRPDIISRGFVYVRESGDLISEARDLARKSVEDCINNEQKGWNQIKSVLRDDMRDFIWKKTERSPMILPIILDL